jgi:hypothetical protein
MADSSNTLPLIDVNQAEKEVSANALFTAGSPILLFGVDPRNTTALTFGYLGGKYRKADGTILEISDGTVTLTASATNYIKETDGVVSVTTAAPSGWPGPLSGGAKALYQVVCDSSGVNPAAWPTGGYKDYRTNGIGSGNGSGSVTSVGLSVPAFLSVSGSPVTGAGTLTVTYSGTALPVANGGTGATSASAARTSLGLAIGTDVQAYSAKLADIAGLTYAQGDILYYNGTNVVNLGAGTSGQFLKTQGTGANPVWASATGATLADGDYGDITVSSSGTVMSIDNNTVTYAKMQDVSATSRVLGRKTAGAGDPEELTLSDVLDFIGSAAQGDILYRGASGWARLAAGTSGQFLQTQGASANPQWASEPFDATAFYPGVPGNSAKVLRVPVARAVTFAANFSGSYAKAGTAATGSCSFDIQKNGSSVGTISFSASGTSGTFTSSGGTSVSFAAGDVLGILAPSSSDATLADIGIVLAGTR